MPYARDLCGARIYAANTVSEEESSIHQPTTHMYRNAVILVPVVKACIPTLISRCTDQEIYNSKAQDKALSSVYMIAKLLPYFSQRRELCYPRSSRLCINLTADTYDRLEDCIFAKNHLQVPQN